MSAQRIVDFTHPVREAAHPDHPLAEVAVRLEDQQLSVLPVYDGDEVVGTISESQLAGREGDTSAAVRDVMSAETGFIFEDEDVAAARSIMDESHHDFLVVVDRERQIVGMIGRGDLPEEAGHAGAAEGGVKVSAGRASTVVPGGLNVYSPAPKLRDDESR